MYNIISVVNTVTNDTYFFTYLLTYLLTTYDTAVALHKIKIKTIKTK